MTEARPGQGHWSDFPPRLGARIVGRDRRRRHSLPTATHSIHDAVCHHGGVVIPRPAHVGQVHEGRA
eukprot:4270512-Alexandrium_andersonii.AAC.1